MFSLLQGSLHNLAVSDSADNMQQNKEKVCAMTPAGRKGFGLWPTHA
jgi:hypothetical protein